MFEFTDPTPIQTGWCIFLYAFLLVCCWRQNMATTEERAEHGSLFIFIGMLVFAMTAFCNGDFYHYVEWVENANVHWNIDETAGQEVAYQYISSALDGAYLPFRLVVWGSALVLMALTAKRLDVDVHKTFFVILMLFAVQYSYARATLAMSIYFYGFSYIVKPARIGRLPSLGLGLVIILFSPIFHRSMYVLITLTAVCLLPTFTSMRKNRLALTLYAVANFLAVFIVARILLSLDLGGLTGDDTMANKLLNYADMGDTSDSGIAYLLQELLITLQTWSSFIIITWSIFKKSDEEADKRLILIYKITLSILMTSLAFSISGEDFHVLTYRIRIMSFISFSILVVYALQEKILPQRQFRWIIAFGATSTGYQLLYSFYCSIVM